MKKSGAQGKRESRTVWSKRYQQWQSSDLSKAHFCKQEGLNATCFYYWCGIFRKEPPLKQAVIQTRLPVPRLLPVNITDTPVALTIECQDIKLSCPSEVSGDQLYQWVKALRRATCSG